MNRNLGYGMLIAASSFLSGYFCPLKHISPKDSYFHCDLLFRYGGENSVCFDRTDGHGNRVPYTERDKKVVNIFGVVR